MKTMDLLALDAQGTTYDPLTKPKNKARALSSAISAAKRASASLFRRKQRSQGVNPGEWVYNVNGESMSVDEIINNGLVDVIRSKSKAQMASAKASMDTAIELDQHIMERIVQGL